MFSLCVAAHAEAALTACEHALSLTPSPVHKRARAMLVWMETAREHLLRILLDWPGFADEVMTGEPLRKVMQLLPSLQQALYGGIDPFVPGSVPRIDSDAVVRSIDELCVLIARVLGSEDGTSSPLGSLSAFERWLERGEVLRARLLRRLREQNWGLLGRTEPAWLPNLDGGTLGQCMAAGDSFVAEPTWLGAPCETTPLERQREQPLVRKLLEGEGAGLLTRLAARLVELQRIPQYLCEEFGGLKRGAMDPVEHKAVASSGIGLAQVEAARGRLVHWVEIENGTVRRYRILAPTEWNFHPDGVAARGLLTLGAADGELLRQATLWVNAVDPCIGFRLRKSGHA